MFINIFYISITILLLLLIFKQSQHKNGKNQPPSPPSLPIIGHLHLIGHPLHQALARLSDRYGPIISLRFGARPILVVSSTSIAEECLSKNDVVFANRVPLPSLKHISYDYKSLAMSNYGPYWRNMRRIAAVDLLSSHHLSLLTDVRASEANAILRRLFREFNVNGSHTKAELSTRLYEFSLNSLMTMITGKKPNESKEVKQFQDAVEGTFKVAGASNLSDFLPFLGWLDFQGVTKKSKLVANYKDLVLQKILDARRETKNKEFGVEEEEDNNMIGHLLSLQKTDPENYSDEIIKALLSDLLTAGTDTTANSLEWAMALLLNSPNKLKKAQSEIDELLKHERLVEESDLSNLPYLDCIVKETYRHYPGGPLLLAHRNYEDCIIGGYNIPKGTMLLVNAYAIHRDKNDWEDANEFVPERFYDKKDVTLFAFGMGRRKCPGEALANREVGLVLGRMIQCFDWERVGDELIDMTEDFGLSLPKLIPLEALYKPRESMKKILMDL